MAAGGPSTSDHVASVSVVKVGKGLVYVAPLEALWSGISLMTGSARTCNWKLCSSVPPSFVAARVTVYAVKRTTGFAHVTMPVSGSMSMPAGADERDQLMGAVPCCNDGCGPVYSEPAIISSSAMELITGSKRISIGPKIAVFVLSVSWMLSASSALTIIQYCPSVVPAGIATLTDCS